MKNNKPAKPDKRPPANSTDLGGKGQMTTYYKEDNRTVDRYEITERNEDGSIKRTYTEYPKRPKK